MDEACFVVDPPAGWRIKTAYFAAGLVVATAFAGALAAFDRTAPEDVASDATTAVLIDLPAAVAAQAPSGGDAAPQAPTAAAMPARDDTPKPDAKEAPSPDTPQSVPPSPTPLDLTPPDLASSDLTAKQEAPPPPPMPAAPPAAAQEAQAPAGSEAPVPQPDAAADEGGPRASAHLVTIWQKALMARLEAAKRGLGHGRRASGVVEIAFAIDRDGKLRSEEIRSTSGIDALDKAALVLVRQAAPFPPSPAGVRDADLSFVVPIRFRR